MISSETILKEVKVTEKTNILSSKLNKYTFNVFKGSNRKQIAKAIEDFFKVKVKKVNVINQKGKRKNSKIKKKLIQRPNTRRAIVTLFEGSKIEII